MRYELVRYLMLYDAAVGLWGRVPVDWKICRETAGYQIGCENVGGGVLRSAWSCEEETEDKNLCAKSRQHIGSCPHGSASGCILLNMTRRIQRA